MHSEKEDKNTAGHLLAGETRIVTGYNQSMTPKLESGESAIMEPVNEDTVLEKGDIVLAKANRHCYCHPISAIRGKSHQISNNCKHANGWVSKKKIYGRMTSKA